MAAGLVALVAVALAAVAIGAAGAGVNAAAHQYAGKPDRLTGSGERLSLAGQRTRVDVSAISDSNGGNAHGTFKVFVETVDLGTVSFRGKVHCLTVEGNRAAALGTVEKSTAPPVPVGSLYQVQATDNRSSGSPDTNINFFGFEPGTTECPIIPFDEIPITKGNFTVHDG